MYCSSCGIEVTQELNYCNRCGANLSPPANLVAQATALPVKLTGPTIALGATVVCSLVAIFKGIEGLAIRGVHPTAIAWIAIISLAMVFGVASLLVRLWINLLGVSSRRAGHEQQPAKLNKPQYAPPLASAQTGPMQQPISSVTDHTTRTFEPARRK